jgi:hypothetical protein
MRALGDILDPENLRFKSTNRWDDPATHRCTTPIHVNYVGEDA